MSGESGKETFEGWAVLELMGHRRIAGYVREVVVAGAGLLRVEMPADDAGQAITQYYSPSALYCMTPTTEEAARVVLVLSRPEPVSQWDMDQVRRLRETPRALPGGAVDEPPVDEDDGAPGEFGSCASCGAPEDEPCPPECPEFAG